MNGILNKQESRKDLIKMMEKLLNSKNALKAVNCPRENGDLEFDVTFMEAKTSSSEYTFLEDLKGGCWEFHPSYYSADELEKIYYFEPSTNVTLSSLDENERYAIATIECDSHEGDINLSAEEVIEVFEKCEDCIQLYQNLELNIFPMSSAKNVSAIMKYETK